MNTGLLEYLQENTKNGFLIDVRICRKSLIFASHVKLLFLITNTGKTLINILFLIILKLYRTFTIEPLFTYLF